MDASTGVSIAHSLDVSDNLQVNGVCTFIGNVSAPNLYTKTETNNLLSNYALNADLLIDLLLNTNSAAVYTQTQIDNMLNAKQNSLAFHDDELNYQYPLLNVSTVRSLENGSYIMITPTATSLNIYVAPSLTVESFTVKSTNPDAQMKLCANGEDRDAILYFGTPVQGIMSNGLKSCHYSRRINNIFEFQITFVIEWSGT